MTLQLKGIRKGFAQGDTQLQILQDLELELRTGDVVAVVGESGSGKSTLLSLLAGFDKPDAGEVRWDGQDASKWHESRWAQFRKESLGFVFQNYHLIPYLTAQENVGLPLKLLHRNDTNTSALSLLTRLQLEQRADHLPSQMSGGENQRVAIARALVHNPSLILADEPTGSLDVRTGQSVLDLLFGLLAEKKQTALIVTHSHEVAARCHRTLTLRQGRLWPA